MIANQIVFDPVLDEELKDFGIVVLVDLDLTKDSQGCSPPTPRITATTIVLRRATSEQRAALPTLVGSCPQPTTADSPESAQESVCGPSHDDRMASVDQIIQSIEGRLQELRAEIWKFEDAKRALTNGSAKPAPKGDSNGAQSKVPSRQRRKPKRSTQVMLAGQLEPILGESSDGLSTSAIAEQGNADPAQVLTLLRELEKSGQVRRTGERRRTRWHLVTDEDRIAERAADLAIRSAAVV